MPSIGSSVLKDFELRVIEALTEGALADGLRSRLQDEASLVDLSFDGIGYHLTVHHRDLPVSREVCDYPFVFGRADGILVGFIIFLEDKELTIDCHSFTSIAFPTDFRERSVSVER